MTMKLINSILTAAAFGAALAMGACTEDSPKTTWPDGQKPGQEPVEIPRGTFARGADVSWITEFEQAGYTFQNKEGKSKELMELLRDDCGVDAIRLRVFVNPENSEDIRGWCNIDDVVVKARRAHALGLRLMIDFHFSDNWADPGKQAIPAAWEGMEIDQTLGAITGHVTEMMEALKHFGIEPEWVQIGNETRTGMLWPLGKHDNGDNFSRMVTAGTAAVKAVFPEALTIVHVDNGGDLGLYTRLFGLLQEQGAQYDMIGMSLYPSEASWEEDVEKCIANVPVVNSTYGKPVMLCEVGYDRSQPEIARSIMAMLMDRGRTAGLQGIFWWEPETPAAKGYNKGCFDDNGCPTSALDPFVNFVP